MKDNKFDSRRPRARILTEIVAVTMLVVSIWSLWLALTLPIFTVIKSIDLGVTTLEDATSFGIFSTMNKAFDTGNSFLGGVILVFTIILPIVKLLLLTVLYLGMGLITPKRAYKVGDILERIGRWAMLDVLLIAVGITLYSFRSWGVINTEIGIFFFTAAVLGTMLSGWQIMRIATRTEPEKRLPLRLAAGIFCGVFLFTGGGAWAFKETQYIPIAVNLRTNLLGTHYFQVCNIGTCALLNVQITCLSPRTDTPNDYRIARLDPGEEKSFGFLWCINECPDVEQGVEIASASHLSRTFHFEDAAQ